MVGSITWVLLEIYLAFQQWKNFEYPLRIDKVIAMSLVYYFLGHSVDNVVSKPSDEPHQMRLMCWSWLTLLQYRLLYGKWRMKTDSLVADRRLPERRRPSVGPAARRHARPQTSTPPTLASSRAGNAHWRPQLTRSTNLAGRQSAGAIIRVHVPPPRTSSHSAFFLFRAPFTHFTRRKWWHFDVWEDWSEITASRDDRLHCPSLPDDNSEKVLLSVAYDCNFLC